MVGTAISAGTVATGATVPGVTVPPTVDEAVEIVGATARVATAPAATADGVTVLAEPLARNDRKSPVQSGSVRLGRIDPPS